MRSSPARRNPAGGHVPEEPARERDRFDRRCHRQVEPGSLVGCAPVPDVTGSSRCGPGRPFEKAPRRPVVVAGSFRNRAVTVAMRAGGAWAIEFYSPLDRRVRLARLGSPLSSSISHHEAVLSAPFVCRINKLMSSLMRVKGVPLHEVVSVATGQLPPTSTRQPPGGGSCTRTLLTSRAFDVADGGTFPGTVEGAVASEVRGDLNGPSLRA